MMLARVSGTIVVWKVVDEGDEPVLRIDKKKGGRVSVYTDGPVAADFSTLSSEYILLHPDQQGELILALRNGLLQVYDIQRTALTTPQLPSLEASQSSPTTKSTAGQPR